MAQVVGQKELQDMTRDKAQFQGMHTHRYVSDPMEKRFAKAWQEFNARRGSGPTHFEYLMDPNNRGHPDPPLTKRDWLIAATVIQWLGSPVGLFFLGKVLGFDKSIVEVLGNFKRRFER